MAWCMLMIQALPHTFWLQDVMWASYVLDKGSTKIIQAIKAYKTCNKGKLSKAYLQLFDYLAYAFVLAQQCNKLDDIWVACSAERRGYLLYYLSIQRLLVHQDAILAEHAIHPLLSCTKRPNSCSKEKYDTSLPLVQADNCVKSIMRLIQIYKFKIST